MLEAVKPDKTLKEQTGLALRCAGNVVLGRVVRLTSADPRRAQAIAIHGAARVRMMVAVATVARTRK